MWLSTTTLATEFRLACWAFRIEVMLFMTFSMVKNKFWTIFDSCIIRSRGNHSLDSIHTWTANQLFLLEILQSILCMHHFGGNLKIISGKTWSCRRVVILDIWKSLKIILNTQDKLMCDIDVWCLHMKYYRGEAQTVLGAKVSFVITVSPFCVPLS